MLYDQARAHLAAAAAATLSRIEEAIPAAPRKLRPALSYLREHLFDPELQVSDLRQACGVRDNSFSLHFREAVGEAPRAYLAGCRLEVATRLLARTELTVSLIAELIGYSTLHTFSAAFERWAGQRPVAYRRQARASAAANPPPEAVPLEPARLRRAVLGSLEGEEAESLLAHLKSLYGEGETEPRATDEPWVGRGEPSSAEEEKELAQGAWALLAPYPFEMARELLLRHPALCTPSLADLLRLEGRIAGWRDRRRCMEISALALECVQAYKARWREGGRESVREVAQLEAQAWIWVGNACRLALCMPQAERAFAAAEEHLPREPDREVLAELLGYLGALRWYQRRLAEGLVLEERAIALFRLVGRHVPLAEALLTLGGLRLAREEPEASLASFLEGLSLLDDDEEPALVLGGSTMATRANLQLGRLAEARRHLRRALGVAERLGKRKGLRALEKALL